MFSIVIADDEQLEREALKCVLENYFEGDCRITLAANGREALEAVRRTHADIALMDIEMPGMGGIEASRHIRKELPGCRILFLTAYSEFSYAREAVELGAMDYLLKPCSDRDLYQVIGRVVSQIESQRDEEKRNEMSNRKIENLTQWLEEQLVLTIMGGYLRPERVRSQLEELNIAFNNGVFAILRSPDSISAERIRSMVKGCGWSFGIRLIMYEYDDRLYMFVVSSTEKEASYVIRSRIGELSDQLLELSHKRLFCGVGGGFYGLEDAQKSFYQALTATGRCSDENRLCAFCSDQEQADKWEPLGIETAISSSILDGDTENVRETMLTLLESLSAQQLDYKVAVERLEKRMRVIFTNLQDESGIDYTKKYNLQERFSEACDIEHLGQVVLAILKELCGDVNDADGHGGRMAQIMQDITDYIDKNYRRDIFLQQVAHEMNYSDAYFSKLFKQCFNKNFVTYLTETRVEAAKKLLHNPTVNIKDIGAQVGYHDSNYFTKVFRRATGKSPSEYRSSILSVVAGE